MSQGDAFGEVVRERGEGRSVATAAVLDFLRVTERRADVLVAALALDDLRAMLGEEARGDAGVAERAEVDLKVGLRFDEEFSPGARTREGGLRARKRARSLVT
jgi:hypothetical protein